MIASFPLNYDFFRDVNGLSNYWFFGCFSNFNGLVRPVDIAYEIGVGTRASNHPRVLFMQGHLGFHRCFRDETPNSSSSTLNQPLAHVDLLLGQGEHLFAGGSPCRSRGGRSRSRRRTFRGWLRRCRRSRGKQSLLFGALRQIDSPVSVQDAHGPGSFRFGHANRQDNTASFDRTAVDLCFVLLNIPAKETMPQAGLAQLVACHTQSLAVNQANLSGSESRGFQATLGILGVLRRFIQCNYLFVINCCSFHTISTRRLDGGKVLFYCL